jgi:hypothetical protein
MCLNYYMLSTDAYVCSSVQVLILHLKRFTFDPARGPLKVVKPVDYAPSLTIPANLLSSSLKATLPKGAR